MRRFTTPRRQNRTRRRRGGTTLTEVLMSLLIMGIGLSSVATLFPLSVLRSIEATQQTTATTLRYAAEALIDASGTEPVYASAGVLKTNWRTNDTTSLIGCRTAAIALDPDGDHDPKVNDTDYNVPGIATTPPTGNYYGYVPSNHREGFYVVDPLGYWRLRQQAETHGAARFFGDWSGVGSVPTFGTGASAVTWNINRFSLNIPDNPAADLYPLYGFTGTDESFTGTATGPGVTENAKRAELAVGLPDSFITVADGRQSEGTVTISGTGISFPSAGGATGDFSMFMGGSGADPVMLERGQVTVFSADGRRSMVRELETDGAKWTTADTDIPAGTLQFKTPLPASFVAAGVDRVIVESNEDRYTWMLTVRRKEPASLIDVVVFFRRAFGRQDERIYLVTQEFSNVAGFNVRKQEQKEYFVAWNSSTDPRPEVDEGDWMFDPVNFRWHKIGQVLEEEPFTLPGGMIRPLGLPAGYVCTSRIRFRLEGSQVADEPVMRGVFMQGVVDVYPIEPKTAR